MNFWYGLLLFLKIVYFILVYKNGLEHGFLIGTKHSENEKLKDYICEWDIFLIVATVGSCILACCVWMY